MAEEGVQVAVTGKVPADCESLLPTSWQPSVAGIIVDGPVQNGCPGEELTPHELFLSAVASCGVELVHVIAKDQGVGVGKVNLAVHGTVDRGKQKRTDVTVFNAVRLEFSIGGTDGATAAQLVEGFKRR